jgi:spoIIIJ-associated protein
MKDVQQRLTDLLTHLGVTFTAVTEQQVAGQTVLTIETSDTAPLIGFKGETIRSIDFLLKRMCEQLKIQHPPFLVDVGGYRVRKIEELQQKARIMADRARSFQYDVEMSPMSAYERLIVHAALSDMEHIKTESRGEGLERRIVIKYVA